MTAPSEDGRPLVIVAEDDEDILALVAFRLKKADYSVLEARDGEEALELVLGHSPDLAVLDVRMPKRDGLDVTRQIRENDSTSRMPVILVSASVQEADVARGFEAGADDYLKKPFSPEKLLERVQAALGRR